MNVTVVGSYQPGSPYTKEQFREACEAIGKRIAECRHRLILPHADNPGTAEIHALRGFQTVVEYNYQQVSVHKGDPVLKAHFDAVEMSDAVILIGGLNGTYAAGLGALRRRKLIIPIPVFGGSAKDLCEIPEINNMVLDELRNLNVGNTGWIDILVNALETTLNAFPHILIIHGRGDNGDDLKKMIVEKSRDKGSGLFGVATPLIMNLAGKGALSVPNVFEDLASQVSATIAIVTADDVGGFARISNRDFYAKELRLEPRARENVWVEVGWFWGRLGRHRVFLWLKDDLKLPTDLQGAAWTRANKLEDAWESIRSFMVYLRNPESEHVLEDIK